MAISVFDLFRIGIGPSSSHTVGPMRASRDFALALGDTRVTRLVVRLHGSLAATGVGHGTDQAVIMGLMGEAPESIDPDTITSRLKQLAEGEPLLLANGQQIAFDAHNDVEWDEACLPFHPNAMVLSAYCDDALVATNTFYSLGGGFYVDQAKADQGEVGEDATELTYPFNTAAELLALCRQHQLRISQLMLENEKAWRSESTIREELLTIWHAMSDSIENGLRATGHLPGGLNVRRRAQLLHQQLLHPPENQRLIVSSFTVMDWVNVFALAVNEENAAGRRMVTAPTNGAAGIVPAVLAYYLKFEPDASEADVVDFLLTAGAVGILCKKNASISGAEVGCQGEVGSACAMAAAGLAEVLGGTPGQVENAAEIGLEHNLGLTCDPVGGLVQVPCIERNAIASVKAINAARMALHGDGEHFISLDKVIRTMRDTGRDMQDKYKETSKGGLAVNAIEC
ncbi:L-serine ammonia-lyase [Halomonas sp. ATBC28]|uniref:L-serine dehydratase n=1 Tax=Vreelandella titanicae TaxID=664683 RepID=A0AAP9T119_9GAMM|nr:MULTISPECIES: L-serine ammonia-lyase [Halomonas]PKH61482.1 L-serine ammonia-lyase [Halomonas sp. Choline-3u-9]QGQ72330.1 L-serine ammonia-lyase [Halomonas sp. PA16-9]QKS24830.1 L-serine dehydratase 1 [Halomonas titanicae]TMU14809.1 L-serine ammonia-lyase [Halomonas sp. ATBC28]